VPVVIVRLFNTVGPRQTGNVWNGFAAFRFTGVAERTRLQFTETVPDPLFRMGRRCSGSCGQLAQLPAAEGLLFNIGSDEEVDQ